MDAPDCERVKKLKVCLPETGAISSSCPCLSSSSLPLQVVVSGFDLRAWHLELKIFRNSCLQATHVQALYANTAAQVKDYWQHQHPQMCTLDPCMPYNTHTHTHTHTRTHLLATQRGRRTTSPPWWSRITIHAWGEFAAILMTGWHAAIYESASAGSGITMTRVRVRSLVRQHGLPMRDSIAFNTWQQLNHAWTEAWPLSFCGNGTRSVNEWKKVAKSTGLSEGGFL
eukprot:scaffold235881_cov18-Tisochrysis_lutea.AAC.1